MTIFPVINTHVSSPCPVRVLRGFFGVLYASSDDAKQELDMKNRIDPVKRLELTMAAIRTVIAIAMITFVVLRWYLGV